MHFVFSYSLNVWRTSQWKRLLANISVVEVFHILSLTPSLWDSKKDAFFAIVSVSSEVTQTAAGLWEILSEGSGMKDTPLHQGDE